jgi:hypothetical protein
MTRTNQVSLVTIPMNTALLNSPDYEAIQNFEMSKPRKDDRHKNLSTPVKDIETQSVTSEKEQSDAGSEKLEKRGRRK